MNMISLLWALLALWTNHVHKQPAPAYLVRYDCTFNEHFDRDRLDRHYFAELRLQGDSSYFFLTPDDSWPPEPEAPNTTVYHMDTLLRVAKARDAGRLFFGDPFLRGKDQFFEDSLYPMHWLPVIGEKMVGGLRCKGATTHFKGRTYTCWYSTEVPVSEGPWKLGGLPGLITEAYDDADDLHFTLASLEPNTELHLGWPEALHAPLGDYEQYREQWRSIARRIEAAMSNPDGGNCISCQTKSKIKFYLWEKPLD